ncbi:MAG: hypothetical protein ACYCQK_01510 [Acidiferrobacteraceae bacterium]
MTAMFRELELLAAGTLIAILITISCHDWLATDASGDIVRNCPVCNQRLARQSDGQMHCTRCEAERENAARKDD